MYTPLGTIYWRAIRRMERRSLAYRADPTFEGWILTHEAVRTCNRLAHLFLGGH
jgi:hypothetical protein